jgi:hypothetical protein
MPKAFSASVLLCRWGMMPLADRSCRAADGTEGRGLLELRFARARELARDDWENGRGAAVVKGVRPCGLLCVVSESSWEGRRVSAEEALTRRGSGAGRGLRHSTAATRCYRGRVLSEQRDQRPYLVQQRNRSRIVDRQQSDQLRGSLQVGASCGPGTGRRLAQLGRTGSEKQRKTIWQLRPRTGPFGEAARRCWEHACPRGTLGRLAYSRIIPPRWTLLCTNDERKERWRVNQSRLFEKGDPPSRARYMCRRRGRFGDDEQIAALELVKSTRSLRCPGRDGRFALLEWSEPRQGAASGAAGTLFSRPIGAGD